MHIVQLLPELTQGGVERYVVELSRELIRLGHQSTVISAGGKLVGQIEEDGGRHITLDLCSKNPFTIPFRVFRLRKILRKLQQKTRDGGRLVRRSLSEGERTEGSLSSVSPAKAEGLKTANRSQPFAHSPLPPTTCNSQGSSFKSQVSSGSPLILHAHSRIPAWLCFFANRPLRVPFVTTVHGFNHISRYSRIMTRGDHVIAVSSQVRDYIQKHYATSPQKISVIPCGVDAQEFDPDKLNQNWMQRFEDQFKLKGKTVITAIGRISRAKDYETFIRAVATCAENNPDIRGLIVGTPKPHHLHYQKRLETLIHHLGMDDVIFFAGYQTRLPEIYHLSSMVVSSSKKPETFGLTLIEAMAMNTPVIATRHGGPLDIITEGKSGRFFAPSDAADLAKQIEKTLAGQPQELRAQTIQAFCSDASAKKTEAVYEELLNTIHVVQLVPELNQGGVERGTVELSRELVKRGHTSTVISAGGKLVEQIEQDGGRHITLDVCSKNPFTVPLRVSKLRKILRKLARRSEVSRLRQRLRRATGGQGAAGFAKGYAEPREVGGQESRDEEQKTEDVQVSSFKPQVSSGSPLILHARSRVPAWLTWFANKQLKLPFITTVHGFNSVSKYSAIMTRGDRVLYGSTAIKEYVLKNYAVDEFKLRYVPRGIDTNYFNPEAIDQAFIDKFKRKYKLEEKTVVSIVGRITEWKGHDTFIRALAEVQKTHPDIVGVVVGGIWHDKQDYFQTLEKLAADRGTDIRFVGSQSQVREIYALSILVVSAAFTTAETFGRTTAEALAMNTPVVASAHGGSLDILLDAENGLFFEPGNETELAERINQALSFHFSNLRNHIEKNFSLERMTEDELTVYNELR